MKGQEKKFIVSDLDQIRKELLGKGGKLVERGSSDHYYVRQSSNDVLKLVVSDEISSIHRLEDKNGQFALIEKIDVPDRHAGFGWLQEQGYDQVDLVHMDHEDYDFEGGIVGLYLINGEHQSVILEYGPGNHGKAQNQLGLSEEDVINIPYNKYLERRGSTKQIALER